MRYVLNLVGVDDAADAARRLTAAGLGVSRSALIRVDDQYIPASACQRIAEMVEWRARGLAETRVIGRRGFHRFEMPAHPAVLDPRPDSETLIDALREDASAPRRILDLGCGSGALLAAALLDHPDAMGVGVERSADAAAYAETLIRSLGLTARAEIIIGDAERPENWAKGDADAALANPPYLTRAEVAAAPRGVREGDPFGALDGGEDGLDGHRAFARGLIAALRPGGRAFVEIGAAQAQTAAAIYGAAGFTVDGVLPDLAARPRALKLGAPVGEERPA